MASVSTSELSRIVCFLRNCWVNRSRGLVQVPWTFVVEELAEEDPLRTLKGKKWKKSMFPPLSDRKKKVMLEGLQKVFEVFDAKHHLSSLLDEAEWEQLIVAIGEDAWREFVEIDNRVSRGNSRLGYIRLLRTNSDLYSSMLNGTRCLDFDIYKCPTTDKSSPHYFYYSIQGDDTHYNYCELHKYIREVGAMYGTVVETTNGGLHCYTHAPSLDVPTLNGVTLVSRVFPNSPSDTIGVLDIPQMAYYIPPMYITLHEHEPLHYHHLPVHPMLELVYANNQKVTTKKSSGRPSKPFEEQPLDSSLSPVESILACPNVTYANKTRVKTFLEGIYSQNTQLTAYKLILSVLDKIDPSLSYADWTCVMIACMNYGISYEDFDAWCRGGSNYNEHNNRMQWMSIRQRRGKWRDCNVYSTLRKYATITSKKMSVQEKYEAKFDNLYDQSCYAPSVRILTNSLPDIYDCKATPRVFAEVIRKLRDAEFLIVSDKEYAHHFFYRNNQYPYWDALEGADEVTPILLDKLFKALPYMDVAHRLWIDELKYGDDDSEKTESKIAQMESRYANFTIMMTKYHEVAQHIRGTNHREAKITADELFKKPYTYLAFLNKIIRLDGEGNIESIVEPTYEDMIMDYLHYNLLEEDEVKVEIAQVDELFKRILWCKTTDADGNPVMDKTRYDFLLTWMAHRLFGKEVTHSQILNSVSDGSNGKGLFSKIMCKTFDRYATFIPATSIVSKEINVPLYEALQNNIRVMFITESTNKTITPENIEQIKRLTTDEISCRNLYANKSTKKTLNTTFLFESNDTLCSESSDGGMNRRFTPVFFPNKVFGDNTNPHYNKNHPNHVDISDLPYITDKMSERYKSAVVHILLRYVSQPLPSYTTDDDIKAMSIDPLLEVLNKFVSLQEYNDSIGYVPTGRCGNHMWSKIPQYLRFSKQIDVANYIQLILLHEYHVQDIDTQLVLKKMKLTPTFKRLIQNNDVPDPNQRAVRVFKLVYPPHHEDERPKWIYEHYNR